MLKAAISVEADLASRIAIRYVCELGRHIDMTFSTLHALEPGEQGRAIATGWVRQTWQHAVVQDTMSQVTRLVRSERGGCRLLGNPIFLPPGQDRDDRITDHLASGRYDLFVEGILHGFEPAQFMERIDSRLYRHSPCPILLAKNVPPWSKGVLWVSDGRMTEQMMAAFLRIFPIQSMELALLTCHFDGNRAAAAGGSAPAGGVGPAVALFESEGGSLKSNSTAEGSPSAMAALVRDHFLIVSAVPPASSPLAQLLAKSPCSLLLLP